MKYYTFIGLNGNICTYVPSLMKFYCLTDKTIDEFEDFLKTMKPIPNTNEVEYYEKEKYFRKLILCVYNGCNLKCKYCFADAGSYDKKPKMMSKDQMIKAFHAILSRYEQGIQTINFYGGEPLLGFKEIKAFCDYVIDYCKKNPNIIKPHFTIFTNGTLITKEIWEFFKEYKFGVEISIDGDKKITDKNRISKIAGESVYDRIAEVMSWNKNGAMRISSTSTLTPEDFLNYDGNIEKYNQTFIDLGFSTFYVAPAEGDGLDYSSKEVKQKVKLFYTDLCKYWFNRILKDEDIKAVPLFIMGCIQLIVCSEKKKLCGSGRDTIFYGTDDEFYKCQLFHKTGHPIDIDNLCQEVKYKPILPKCEDCISKFTCRIWCEGDVHAFGKGTNSPSDVLCVMQQTITSCIVEWVCSLNEEQQDIVAEKIRKDNIQEQ